MKTSDFLPILEKFTSVWMSRPPSVLDTPWGWQSYQEEGVRFGILRLVEILKAAAYGHRGMIPTGETVLFLRDYVRAYWDLQAVLYGVTDGDAVIAPAEGEWDVRTTLSHLLGAEMSFYVVLKFALKHHRQGTWREDLEISDADWDHYLHLTESQFKKLMAAPLSVLRNAHLDRHNQICEAMGGVTPAELEMLSRFWENEPYPIRFRLGRFASHLRQHTLQIEKILAKNGPEDENRKLLRLVYGAFAEISPGAHEADLPGLDEAARLIGNLQPAMSA